MSKFKDYREYRHNKKVAKRELARIMANVTPKVGNVSLGLTDAIVFLTKLIEGAQNVSADDLTQYIIDGVATALNTNESRLMKSLQYIATLSSDDIMKLVATSAVKTNPDYESKE